jgi:purine-binding chemotaxis protein CheW
VDSVTEIVRINDEDIVDTPPTLKDFDHRFLSGVGKLGDKLILLLDLEKVLTPDEELQVQEIVEQNAAKVLGEGE